MRRQLEELRESAPAALTPVQLIGLEEVGARRWAGN